MAGARSGYGLAPHRRRLTGGKAADRLPAVRRGL